MKAKKAVPALPFRDFFSYGETADFLEKLAAARPHLCRLQSLGRSREGRAIPLLTVTDFDSGVPEDRPGYLVIGNIHAGELSGTHAALFTARELLARRSRPDLLERVAFYIVPRLNPDGAEFVATTAGVLRSRTDRSQKVPNTLYQEDVNGDGLILTMRQEHADGQFVKDSRDERLVVKRRADSGGPFYRLLPEGYIHAWDGSDQVQERGRSFDWNRNWSCDWRPEPEQEGAGDFPFSEPEMRHLAEVHPQPAEPLRRAGIPYWSGGGAAPPPRLEPMPIWTKRTCACSRSWPASPLRRPVSPRFRQPDTTMRRAAISISAVISTISDIIIWGSSSSNSNWVRCATAPVFRRRNSWPQRTRGIWKSICGMS